VLPRPTIFISAVSQELSSARQLVASTLQFQGYEPVWQDIFGTEQGDPRAMLRKKIDACRGVVQIVGQCYGTEPPTPDEEFGRVSYTQYEARYARQQGKKVWFIVLAENYPCDPHENEPEELLELQANYRQRVQADTQQLFHLVTTEDGLKAKVHEIRDELARLRRRFLVWAAGVVTLLIVIAALVIWVLISVRSQRPPEVMTGQRANAAFIARNYATAFDCYVQLSDSDPANINYHRSIEECARLGQLKKPFLDRYLALVQRQPDNAVFHNYLGNAYLMLDPQDKDGKARKQYESAVSIDPKLAPPLANLGILAFRAGKFDEAESFFKRYVAAAPDDAQGWVDLGLLYVARVEAKPADSQAVTDAENALRKALQVEPGSSAAYKGLGRLYVATQRKKDALNAYQRSYALNDAQPDVRQQIELLAWNSGGARFPSTVADDFRTRGRAGNENTAPAAVIVMRLLDQGQFQQAEAMCREWTKQEPENPLAWRLLGRACEKQGHADEAQKAFGRVTSLLNAKIASGK
jgi:tetratricopeptide (TPR) repeat protein